MITKHPIFRLVLLFVLILFLSNCKIVFYGIEQGIGQMKLIRNSVPIDDVLQDSLFADSLKEKLLLVREIKQYAIDSIGLKESKNYTTLYDQKGKTIVWILYAAPKYKMEAYMWKYPVVGELPYIGFFKKPKAKKEIEKLKSKGYDVSTGTVAAWSTLGYFKDPILSKALYYSEGELAELIIHELTHVTIFVKGESQFNENLAIFVGINGAKQFLIYKYGINSKEYKDYIGHLYDSNKLANYFIETGNQLDSLYNSFSENMLETEKEEQKNNMLTNIINSLDTLEFYDRTLANKYQNNKAIINNAFFMGYKTYYSDVSEFQREYEESYNSNLSNYIIFLSEKHN